MKLSVIVPVYNEERTLETLLEKVRSAPLPPGVEKEIIAVNDGSTDKTRELLDKYRKDPLFTVIHQPKNQGKASAVATGIKNARGEILIVQDADLEYDPAQYAQLIEPILKGQAKVVYGSRFRGSIKGMTFTNRAANVVATATFNFLYRTRLTDINTCYKVFHQDALKGIEITTTHFGFDTEVTCKVVNNGFVIHEIPIQYSARSKKEGKKIDWPKALTMYAQIFRFRAKQKHLASSVA